MKYVIAILSLLLLSTFSTADIMPEQNEMNINTPEELNTACINKSLKYFSEKNKKPHSWRSQWRTDKNIIDVKGVWKVDNTEYLVMCQIKRGLNETLTLISIDEIKPQKGNNIKPKQSQ